MNRNGETNVNRSNERMGIEKYNSCLDVDILFEDGTRQKTTYQKFRTGHVRKEKILTGRGWIGETVEDRFREECRIVEYGGDDNITVQYPNGDIVAELNLEAVIFSDFDHGTNNMEKLIRPAGEKNLIDSLRKQTLENVIYTLNRYRRCVIDRPCSFGKTEIGKKLMASNRYRRCLFLHPYKDDLNADKIRHSCINKTIDVMTYAMFRKHTREQIEKMDYDLVFCDEVHFIGGDEDGKGAYITYQAIKILMETHPQTHFVGATATPIRMDGIPVVSTMFHNHTCFPYTYQDAFEDGILERPYYFYCIYDVERKVRDELKKNENIEMDREELKKALMLSDEDIDEINTQFMDKNIRKCCDKVLEDTSYMRFIAYYLSNEEIHENKKKVMDWFRKAYPDHQIESLIVTGKSGKSTKDIEALPTEPTRPGYKGRIDIVFNCEKLSMQYHSKLVTGLILDRKTRSIAKYTQMIGRVLSCDDKDPKIIFDIVDNIHSDFVSKAPVKVVAEPVIPKFDGKPMTFEELLKKYPHARHWDEIEATNKKARKSEALLSEAMTADISTAENNSLADNVTSNEKMTVSDIQFNSSHDMFPNRIWTQDRNEAAKTVAEAREYAESSHITLSEACNQIAGIEDEYGTYDIYDFDALKPIEEIESGESPETGDNESPEPTHGEPIGFSPNYIYNPETREMYRNIRTLNKRANFEEDVAAAIRAVDRMRLDEIIKHWHGYPGCNKNYKSYEEINVKSPEYKMLKNISEFCHGVSIEKTLMYMIEGKVV